MTIQGLHQVLGGVFELPRWNAEIRHPKALIPSTAVILRGEIHVKEDALAICFEFCRPKNQLF
jgi:hypothetical protein